MKRKRIISGAPRFDRGSEGSWRHGYRVWEEVTGCVEFRGSRLGIRGKAGRNSMRMST